MPPDKTPAYNIWIFWLRISTNTNSSKINPGMSEQTETTNVWIRPINIGALNSSMIIPIKIMCKLQNIAPNVTRHIVENGHFAHLQEII